MVMYAGLIVELGTGEQIFGHSEPRGSLPGSSLRELPSEPRRTSLHPYTQKLLASTPRLHKRVSELAFIPGSPPIFSPRRPVAASLPLLFREGEMRRRGAAGRRDRPGTSSRLLEGQGGPRV